MTSSNLLTISIPTFDRPESLDRLLKEISNILLQSNERDKVSIFVSDNCSGTETQKVLEKQRRYYQSNGLNFSSFSQIENVGMGGNFLECYTRPESKYIWWFSDDDIMLVETFDSIVKMLEEHNPNVVNIGFLQPPFDEENPRYTSDEQGFYYERSSLCDMLSTKLSAIIIKKDNDFSFKFRDIVKSYWVQVYLMLDLALRNGRFYIYPKNVARCDDDFLSIRYPPNALLELNSVVEDVYQRHGIKLISHKFGVRVNPVQTNLNFLAFHALGLAKLDSSVICDIKKTLIQELFKKCGIFKTKNIRCILSFIYRVYIKRNA